ncbi:UNVERIFIED_CONTAM: hypothetical protein C7454_12554 [Acidovorax defluvii]
MKLSTEQMATGRERFLDAHPQVKSQVLSVSQAVADALGVELAEIHQSDTDKAIAEKAEQAGEDADDYFLRYALDSEEERQEFIQARRDQALRAIGLAWHDTREK